MKDWTKVIAYAIGAILIGVGISMIYLVPGGIDHPATIGVFITSGIGLFTAWNRNGVVAHRKTILQRLDTIEGEVAKLKKKKKRKKEKKVYNKFKWKKLDY